MARFERFISCSPCQFGNFSFHESQGWASIHPHCAVPDSALGRLNSRGIPADTPVCSVCSLQHLFPFFFNPLRGSREREGAALDADRDITSLHIRCLQSSCRAAIPASLNGAIKNKWGLLEKLPLQQRLITVTLVCSRKRQREEEIGKLATSLAQIGVIQSWSRPRLLTAKSLDSLKMSIINICV